MRNKLYNTIRRSYDQVRRYKSVIKTYQPPEWHLERKTPGVDQVFLGGTGRLGKLKHEQIN